MARRLAQLGAVSDSAVNDFQTARQMTPLVCPLSCVGTDLHFSHYGFTPWWAHIARAAKGRLYVIIRYTRKLSDLTPVPACPKSSSRPTVLKNWKFPPSHFVRQDILHQVSGHHLPDLGHASIINGRTNILADPLAEFVGRFSIGKFLSDFRPNRSFSNTIRQ